MPNKFYSNFGAFFLLFFSRLRPWNPVAIISAIFQVSHVACLQSRPTCLIQDIQSKSMSKPAAKLSAKASVIYTVDGFIRQLGAEKIKSFFWITPKLRWHQHVWALHWSRSKSIHRCGGKTFHQFRITPVVDLPGVFVPEWLCGWPWQIAWAYSNCHLCSL